KRFNLTDAHFGKNPAYSKEFYRIASKKIHPDVCDIQGADIAFRKLKELYETMAESSRSIDNSLINSSESEKVEKLVEIIQDRTSAKIKEYIESNNITVKILKQAAKKINIGFKSNWTKSDIINTIIHR
ncbi:MAG: hypothetical protein ACRDD7_17720, partial [Peptostreptococcaceae bacterium]